MIPQPDVRPISDKLYRLYEDYTHADNSGKVRRGTLLWTVKAGFEYDGASVPWYLWSIAGLHNDGLMRAASLIHDYIYIAKGRVIVDWGGIRCYIRVTRKQADDLFLHMLKESGMGWRKRNTAYLAVRAWGWTYWKS